MRIVLLGATGFVGHHLLPDLASAGHECLVLCRYMPGCRDLALVPGVELRQADIYDSEVLKEQLEGADAAINMAGILNESGRNGKGFHRVHVELTEKLIEACRATGVRRLLQLSALNAGKGDSHYLVSKGQAEDLIRQATDLDSTIIQPSVIFGEDDAFFNRFATLLKPDAGPADRLPTGQVAARVGGGCGQGNDNRTGGSRDSGQDPDHGRPQGIQPQATGGMDSRRRRPETARQSACPTRPHVCRAG